MNEMFKSGYDSYFENKPGSGFDTDAKLPKDEVKPEEKPKLEETKAPEDKPVDSSVPVPGDSQKPTGKIEASGPEVPLKKETEKDLDFGVGSRLKVGDGAENQSWMITGTEDGFISLAKVTEGTVERKKLSKDELRSLNGVNLKGKEDTKTAETTKETQGSKTAAEAKKYNDVLLEQDIERLNLKAKEKGIGQGVLAFLQRNSKARIAGGLLLAGTRVLSGNASPVILAQALFSGAGGVLTVAGLGAMGRKKNAFKNAEPILSACLDDKGELDPDKLSAKVKSGEIKLDEVKNLYKQFTEIASAKGREINLSMQRGESEANAALRAEMEKGLLGQLKSKFNKMPIWGKILVGGTLAIGLGYGGAMAGGALALKMGASAAVAAKSAMMTKVIASAIPGLIIGGGSRGPKELPQAYERSDVILGLAKVIDENGGISAEDQKEFEEYRKESSRKRAGGAIAGGAIGAAVPLALAAIFGYAEPAHASGKIDANNHAGVPNRDYDPNFPKDLEETKARLVGGVPGGERSDHDANLVASAVDHSAQNNPGGQHQAEHAFGINNRGSHSEHSIGRGLADQPEQKNIPALEHRIEGGHHWNLTGNTGEYDAAVRLSKEDIDGLLDRKLVNPNAATYLSNLMEKGIVKPGDVALSHDGKHLLFLNSGEHGLRQLDDNAVWVSNIKSRGFLGMFGSSRQDQDYVQGLIREPSSSHAGGIADIDRSHSTPAPHPLESRANGEKSNLDFTAEQNGKIIAEGNLQTEPEHGGGHQDFTVEQAGKNLETEPSADFTAEQNGKNIAGDVTGEGTKPNPAEIEVKPSLDKKIEITTDGKNVDAKFNGAATHNLPDHSKVQFSDVPKEAVDQMKAKNPDMTPYEILQRYKERLTQIDLANKAEEAQKAAE